MFFPSSFDDLLGHPLECRYRPAFRRGPNSLFGGNISMDGTGFDGYMMDFDGMMLGGKTSNYIYDWITSNFFIVKYTEWL